MSRQKWVSAFELEELPVGGSKVFRANGLQLAVFRPEPDAVYAVDNHCPHEGYPLTQGYVKDCVLTCAWHNFKFDLRDGACLMGDEAVRAYPVRFEGGRVEIDLAVPDRSLQVPRLLESLDEGLAKRKLGQVGRNVARLLQAGVPAEQLALAAARFDAERAEFGTTHALPAAFDVLRYLPRYPGVEATLPLLQAFEMASDANVRLAPRPVPEPVDPGEDPAAAGRRLRSLVEAEELCAAEALLRGALAKGWDREIVEPWLYGVCADHFLDFGHALIYQVKLFDLLERVGWTHAAELLPAHLVGIVNGTREDTLPAWGTFRRRLAAVEPRFAELLSRQATATPPAGWSRDGLLAALLDGELEAVFDELTSALERGVPLAELASALVVAASERILRFDPEVDADRTLQEGWLDVTHLLTYNSALRAAVRRYRDPSVLRLVYFGARFVHNARPLDLPPGRRLRLRERSTSDVPEDELLEALGSAIAQRRTVEALELVRSWLARGLPVEPLRARIEDLPLQDRLTRPIVVIHGIKTTVAAFDELLALEGDPMRAQPVLAAVRFLASPVQERRIGQVAHESIRFVVEGKVPGRLTS